MGLGTYYAKADGVVVYQTDFFKGSRAGINNGYQPQLYLYADINPKREYFPMLHLNYTRIRSSGTSSVDIKTQNGILDEILEAINFDDNVFDSTLTYNIYDIFASYKVLKDRSYYPDINFGVGIKRFDYNYDVDVYSGVQFNDNGGSTIPMVYATLRKRVYESISAEFDSKYYIFGDSDIYDIAVKIDMYTPLNDEISIGTELGYRDMYSNIKGNDIENVGGSMRYQGIYLGVVSRFK